MKIVVITVNIIIFVFIRFELIDK